MNTKIIDGLKLSKEIRSNLKIRVDNLCSKNIVPGLAVILVGDNSASQVYVRNKIKACENTGILSIEKKYPENVNETELLKTIEELNKNSKIHGILVQLPLPSHINTYKVIKTIDPKKDVDGFHVINAGLLMIGKPMFLPCTPYGIMKLLESEKINIKGSETVVIGASNIVGKPIAMMLLQKGATVTICNSKTKDLSSHTKKADILIVATGKPNIVEGSMIKTGAILIDVGINRNENNKICGDINFDSTIGIASAITPVPGGVGPMTIAMLLTNTVEAAEKTIV
ncbi:bifunctional methylenetetrahydrofolate dehydrogenase/methenyltetrahydrofolate cyclohydrolase FolD [Candidatus Kinetoplastidibacterium crithidiae]|uniref:Bifunctional protein FolD n=1 Tax=Candidatus Kinetoplastidibacterium crithidiae TCC036E TaxID=1208918 RepID=M1LPI7_9PROT|nr:bifunctional methylenetetrahydrofolate dehydrogenase/methenyltetrahydrofolate cyclohydrolase FolD [Candidatus Kinetoplastibacterium crithidii]AFZ82762.1 methylenetetrahydrofolate dehydrogenase (NADP+) / methenyltetrahydrofolate cyclohydrolase [Candidatus Kinetoplastibacterium crithidii (ex Angomonas deanei ATCC 30255)]AGF47587.1 methylenetetrahydrofolate dehydrogenase (NADP+) [Candidatus Kinetoplastibacterium crithidii TCC036E]EPY40673.1 methylenetetrahydrofolate dehydrogenase (NADP+) [Angomo|eukprot:EPY40673.1 methylenetetrahydrofolate dehydrogenase (NADP+) [Angomonas deanei]